MYCSNWRHRNNIAIWYFSLSSMFNWSPRSLLCISRLSFTGHLRSIWGLEIGQNSCSCGVFGRWAKKEVWCCSGAWFVSSSIDLDRAESLTKPGWLSHYSVSCVMLLHSISVFHSIVSMSYWARCQPSPAPKITVPHLAARERQTKTFKMPKMTKKRSILLFCNIQFQFHEYRDQKHECQFMQLPNEK